MVWGFSAHRTFTAGQFERHLRGANVMLVADDCGYPVGQVWIDLERQASERTAVLWALRVIDRVQGLGIGL